MTDRELLELAAKAAGIELWHEDVFAHGLTRKVSKAGILQWNPLTDDGDALRLASRLLIDLKFFPEDGGFVQAWCEPFSGWLREDDMGDFPAATRRAITRAAAEIGRTMP